MIVGPNIPCTSAASPPDSLWVVSQEEMFGIALVLRDVIHKVVKGGFDLFVDSRIQDGIEKEHLFWETFYETLEKSPIRDISE